MPQKPIRLFESQRLTLNATITLNEDRARYVRSVMRARAGTEIQLFNGTDGEFRAALAFPDKHGANAHVIERIAPPSPPSHLSLWISPLRPACESLAVQKAVELGADAVVPIICERSRGPGSPPMRRARIAEEAAEQCERRSVAATPEAVSFKTAIAQLQPNQHVLWCDECGSGAAPATWQKETFSARNKSVIVLIGPEGGFSESEQHMLRASTHVTPVSLGPRVLKAETAAICALTLCQLHFGDWDERPRYKS